MLKTTVTEDRREIFTIVKAFLTGRYEAEKLLYNHVSYENIEGSRYNVRIYNDELSFTKMGRIWLVRETESFESDFEKETMENNRTVDYGWRCHSGFSHMVWRDAVWHRISGSGTNAESRVDSVS